MRQSGVFGKYSGSLEALGSNFEVTIEFVLVHHAVFYTGGAKVSVVELTN